MAATITADPVGVVAGAPLDLTLVTGDCIDNAQRNELDAYLALLDGGTVHLPYDGVQSGWGGDGFWCPDPDAGDRWKRELGFPSFAGLLEQLGRPFTVPALGIGWLAVVGNHDWLRQGTAITSPALEAIAVGARKAVELPPAFQPQDVLRAYLDEPASYTLGAATREVRADAGRRVVSKDEFISAHITSAARIAGHGFSGAGAPSGDYVHDLERVRIIALDTNHPAGHYQGSVGQRQLEWLDDRIRDAGERLVVVATHHGPESLTNDTPDPNGDEARLLAEPVVAVLHRHPKVVAWLCGHRHVHRITPRPSPDGRGGFWEIVTASIIDWPSQARVVELLELPDGALVIACTVVDHHGDLQPASDAAATVTGLAGVHREIGANLAASAGPVRVAHLAGTAADRNAILAVPR
jgi:metallophosphoesterase (TIGR03767 family)